MADTAQTSDTGLGLSLTFGIIAVLATVAMAGTSYLSFLNDSSTMQLYSGLAFAAALLATGLSVSVFHMFSE